MSGASKIGIAILIVAMVGLTMSLIGYFDIHWSFWGAFIAGSLGLIAIGWGKS